MKIVVCVKQVLDTAHIKFNAQDQMVTDGLEQILNPCCGYALENAIRLKESHEGSTVIVLSLGPAGAKEVLKRAIAMGADEAYHLAEPALLDGDSLATAQALAAGIKRYAPDFDVALFGQFTDDSLSGSTGPATAELLGIPSLTLCNRISLKAPGILSVQRESSQGMEVYEMQLPGMVCFANSEHEPRIPSIKGVMKANRTEIPAVALADLGIEAAAVGKAGSRTMVLAQNRKPRKAGGRQIDGSDPQVAVEELIAFLKSQKVL